MLFASIFAGNVHAQQPYGACWHPEDIKNWSPETDPDAKFNRSTVKYAKRFKEPELIKANQFQFYEGQVCNSTILYHTCSLCPAQGANNFTGYQPTYWQYMDKVVYWAGSASEGIIIPPPAPSIDAAHMNGVKMLGQVFFPPSAFGGTQEWVRQMLTVENGKYIYAIKLYEIAKYMGFDGWFINEETGGGSTSEWVAFVKEFNKIADENGDTQMEIQWYNASGYPNTSILNAHPNTSQFLEYGSVGDYRSYASQLNCTEEEVMQKIYSGVQCVNSGLTGYGSAMRTVYKETEHVGSLDLFCPEERVWKDNVKDILDTQNNCGEKAYAAIEKTFQNEETMWVNRAGDPTDVSERNSWPGFSGCILERSVITSMPFVTSFSTGVGKHRFVNGEKMNTQDWYHSGVQSIMPTWRWWIENKGNLKAKINWDDAYNFGTSIKISGTLTQGDHLTRLYKTMIPVENGGKFRLVYKTNTENSIEVKLGTESKTDGAWITLGNPTITDQNGWKVAEYDLSALKGKTVYIIALNFKATSEVAAYEVLLGELAMLPANYAPVAPTVTNLNTTSVLGEEKGDIRLTWDFTTNEDFEHFDIYTELADGSKKLVGQTRGEAFYIPTFERNGNDAYVNIAVVPVLKDMSEGAANKLKVEYPKATAPKISFKLSKSYAVVGEEVTITAKGTGNPSAYEWVLPSSLQLTAGNLTDATITVKCLAAGKQKVTVKATNVIGTSETTSEVVDVMEEAEIGEVKNVALKKTILDFSGSTNNNETPKNIIDGVTRPGSTSQKWCNISSDHWTVIDLEGAYRIYGFKIYDCNSGPETGQNINSYRIYVSNDAKNWELLVDETGREKDDVKSDFIAPVKARYIKLNPYSESGMTIRIWEFEVYGKDDNNMTVELPATMNINAGKTATLVVNYNLNGDERAEQFTCTAIPSNAFVTIGEITEDTEKGVFNIPVTGANAIGGSQIKVTVNNGGAYKERTVTVTIDSEKAPNILSGMTAQLRQYKSDYSFEAEYDEYTTVDLTDGNTGKEGLMVIENPSSHKDDFWAIFEATETWKLSKIKVYIPDNNQGENDNGNKGSVNNEISFRISNDAKSWTTLKTFSDLQEVSELEYILPEYKECKYLAIVCNLNVYFYPSLAEVEAYEQLAEAIPVMAPVTIKSGFNADVVAEAKPAVDHSTMVLDDQGWVLYNEDIQKEGSLPNDGILTSNSGIKYQLADYTALNAATLKTTNSPITLEFVSAQQAEELYLLSISANGTSKLEVTVNYEDESTDVQTFSIGDWWSASSGQGEAYYGLSRIITKKNGWDFNADDIDERFEFRLFEQTVTADPSKKIVSITLNSKQSGSYPTVLAVSKKGKNESVGVEDTKLKESTVHVYPNPVAANETLYITTDDVQQVSLIALDGTVLIQQPVTKDITEIQMNNISSGMYLLITKGNNGLESVKVIVK